MPSRYDSETGEWVYEDPLQPLAEANTQMLQKPGETPFEQSQRLYEAQGQRDEEALVNPTDPKPFIAQNPGQAMSEVGRQLFNSGGALVTDYLDLFSYLGDTVVETGNVLSGKGFNPDGKFLNDADNPWTQWRIETFEPETQVGMGVRPIIRTGVALLSLPKVGLKGLLTPLTWLGKAPVVGKAARAGKAGLLGASRAMRATDSTADIARSLNALGKTLPKGKTARFAKNMAKTPWLYATYDDVAKAVIAGERLTGVKDWMQSVRLGAKGLTNLGKLSGGQKIRTIGEALAWDAFIAFNASGEGDQLSDETLSDALAMTGNPFWQAIGTPLATNADDAALTRKFKQTAEGTVMGVALNGVFDMWRVYRFAENFKKAGTTTRGEILKRFAGQAQDIGDGMGQRMLPAAGETSFVPSRTPGPEEPPFQGGPGFDAMGKTLEPENWEGYANMNWVPEATDLGRPDADYFPPSGRATLDEMAGIVQEARVVDDLAAKGKAVRAPEPVFSPDAIEAGIEEMIARAADDVDPQALMDQIVSKVREVLPRARVDAMQFLVDNPPVYNDLGLERGASSMWRNELLNRGMVEGWVGLDSNFNVLLKREVARELDLGDLNMKQADAFDQVTDIEQFDLVQSAYDEEAAKTAAKQADEAAAAEAAADPAMASAQVDAVEATQDVVAYEADELARLDAAEVDAAVGEPSPDQLVRELTGQDLQNIDVAELRKAEVGRGWEVYGADGELIERTTTKKAAQKAVEREKRRAQDQLVNKARQLKEDSVGQTVEMPVGPMLRESDLKTKVKLTAKQADELLNYPNMKGFLQQFGMKKKTYDFSMSELSEYVDGFRAMLQTGQIKGPRAKVLKNLIDKFDTAAKLLAPEVRAQSTADGIVSDTKQLLQKGEVCDFLA